jgi:hypothetical protein
MATKSKSGFYATEDSTYYVEEDGAIWCVETEDLRECPFRIRGTELPEGAEDADDLINPDEMNSYIEAIEAEKA